MTIDIYNHLASLDHGQLANLIKNAKIIELVSEVQRGRGADTPRGKIIADAVGGVKAIVTDKDMRNDLFLSFSQKQTELVKKTIGISDIYNIRLTRERKSNLLKLFSIEDEEEEPDDEEKNKEAVSAVSVQYGLFQHQSVALLKAIEYLNSDQPVMLHMPTGAGKPRTAMHLISRYLNRIQNGIVVWLVHGVELCTQAATEFKKAWSVLGERPVPLIEMWGGRTGCIHSQIEESYVNSGRVIDSTQFDSEIWPIDLEDAAIIASVDSINRFIDRWEPGERNRRTSRVRLIVFDEAHQAVAATYKNAIRTLGHNSALLGLSATPGRRHHGQYESEDDELVEMFKGNKVSLEFPGYNSPIEALIDQGYLAKLEKEKLEVANSNLTKAEISAVSRKLSQSLDVDESFMKVVGLDGVRTMQIVDKIEKLTEEGHKRIIVFAPSIESSNLIANILRSMGIQAQSITTKTSAENRNKYLAVYTSEPKETYVLCNYGVLTTGFDAPKTSAVVIARPTTSIVLLSQMAGRAIRGLKVGGNKIAKMVTVVDTAIPELVSTVNQFHAFDDSWGTGQ